MDWKQRKLGEIFQQTSKYINPKETDTDLWSLTIKDGLTPKTDRYQRGFLIKKKDKFKKAMPRDFVYNPMNMTLGAIGYNNTGKAIAVSGYYVTMFSNDLVNDYYINTWMQTTQALNLYKRYATGSLLEKQRVQFPTLSLIPFKMPKIKEQKNIGEFFNQLNNLIALHQEKLSKLQSLKKAALQSLFPQKDETEPKVRFANFKSKWSQRQLGETLIERNIQQTQSIEYPLVSFTVQDGVTPKTERYNRQQLVRGSKKDKKYKVTEFNDIVYNPANLKFGAITRNKYGKAVLSPIYVTFRVNQEIVYPSYIEMTVTNPDFIKYSLRYQQGTVYERQSVNPEDLLSLYISIPEKEEQSDIGLFFEQLNNDVELYKSKLEKLQRLKKSFLQRMFI